MKVASCCSGVEQHSSQEEPEANHNLPPVSDLVPALYSTHALFVVVLGALLLTCVLAHQMQATASTGIRKVDIDIHVEQMTLMTLFQDEEFRLRHEAMIDQQRREAQRIRRCIEEEKRRLQQLHGVGGGGDPGADDKGRSVRQIQKEAVYSYYSKVRCKYQVSHQRDTHR